MMQDQIIGTRQFFTRKTKNCAFILESKILNLESKINF